MPSFITETSVVQPRVLLLAEPGYLVTQIAGFFRTKDFEVTELSPRAVLSQLQSVNFSSFDKIIWVNRGEGESLAEFLVPVQEKTVIISFFSTFLFSQAEYFNEWSKVSRRTAQEAEELHRQLPRALCFFVQDVVKSQISTQQDIDQDISLLTFLQMIFATEVSDPGISLFFQDEVDAWTLLQNQLLLPIQGQRFKIQGKKIESGEVLHILGQSTQQLFGISVHMSGQTADVQCEDFSFATQIIKGKNAFPETSLSGIMQYAWSNWQKKMPVKTQTLSPVVTQPAPQPHPELQPAPVVAPQSVPSVAPLHISPLNIPPLSIPYIENRLKKYEKQVEEFLHRQYFSQYLRPVAPVFQQYQYVPVVKKQQKKSAGKTSVPRTNPNEKEIDRQIVAIFGPQRVQQKVERVKKKVEKTVRDQKKQEKRSVFLWIVAALVGCSLVGGGLISVFLFTRYEVEQQLQSVLQNQSPENASNSVAPLSQFGKFLSWQTTLYKLILGKDAFNDSATLAATALELPSIYDDLQQIHSLSQAGMMGFLGKSNVETAETLLALTGKSQETYTKLSLLQTQLKNLDIFSSQDNQGGQKTLMAINNTLQEERKNLAVSQQLQQFLPNFLGQKGKKTYVILLQNNQELRPTGGFIQSLALVTIDHGQLIDFQVVDASTVDSLFRGGIVPPVEVQTYLGEKTLQFRDSNWSPNFPDSARQAEIFVEKALNKKPDGVIAMNLYVLQDLLQVTGGVPIPEYNEVVSEKNIAERVEFHSEINLVQNKKEYLSTVFEHVLQKLNDISPDKADTLLSALYTNVRNGQLLVSVNDPDQESTLSSLGWSGEVSSPQCPTLLSDTPCVVDMTMQVEANIGSNKSNAYIERSIDERISLSRAQVKHVRTVVLKNDATSNAWPLGSYKTYIRFYVNDSAQLSSIEVNGTVLSGNSITVGSDFGKRFFGVLLEVPIQQTATLTLTYSEPITQQGSFSYAYLEEKQAGTGKDPYKITLNFEDNLHPTLVVPQAEIGVATAKFQGVRDKHVFVGVKLN